MEHEDSQVKQSSHSGSHEDHGHDEIEPVIAKRSSPSEKLASEMKKSGVEGEALELGSHPLEHKPYYSHLFALSSKLVTNRGMVRVSGKHIDLIQVLQRN